MKAVDSAGLGRPPDALAPFGPDHTREHGMRLRVEGDLGATRARRFGA